MSFEGPSVSRMSSNESVSSPLRKKSILALANTDTNETVLNDDDAERRERRRKSVAPDNSLVAAVPPADDPNKRKSLGLGACSGLSSAQLAEHYANCIKLSTENKITVKNAFSLQLIDYMSMMLKSHDKQMEDFQVASCTLDASTKIYSFRVDAVHSDVVQMATSMGRTEAARKKKNAADDGDPDGVGQDVDADDDVPQESQALKKLKKRLRKHKSSITDKPESLLRKQQVFQTMNPFLVRLSADLAVSQSGECPFHHSLKYREDTENILDTKDGEHPEEAIQEAQSFREAQISRGVVPLPNFGDIKDLEICPSFQDFSFVGWRPENDPTPTPDLPCPPANVNDDHAFDMNQTPEPIPEYDCGGRGMDEGMDSDTEEFYAAPEAAARAAARLAKQSTHVVDLRQHLSTVPLEYSYFQQSALSLWAGPTHWKIKPLKKDKEVACQKEAKKRTRKELLLNFENTSELQKCFGSGMKKLNKKTIQGWSVDRVTMPFDIHYDPSRITRLFLRESISIKISDDSTPPEVDEGVGEYPYDNPTDQTSFCPNVPTSDDLDDDNGADLGDGLAQDDDMFTNQDVHTDIEMQEQEFGAFTGDNLIAPPSKVARVYIPYQMRAKKMDMKKLKHAMWEVLTDAPDSDKENQTDSNLQDEADDAEKRKVEGTVHFEHLYKVLPEKLPSKMAENLSCALSFVGLLHLANEKCLDIKGVDEMNDLIIKQG